MSNDRGLVMVVDDDPDIRNVVAAILEAEGYAVAPAANGQEALDYLTSGAPLPRLILLDLMMPVMDGATFREHQRRLPGAAAIPVVIFSAFGKTQEAQQAIDAVGRLPKPLTLDALLNMISRHV